MEINRNDPIHCITKIPRQQSVFKNDENVFLITVPELTQEYKDTVVKEYYKQENNSQIQIKSKQINVDGLVLVIFHESLQLKKRNGDVSYIEPVVKNVSKSNFLILNTQVTQYKIDLNIEFIEC